MIEEFGDSKVNDPDVSVIKHDIVGFDVAVHDSECMKFVNCNELRGGGSRFSVSKDNIERAMSTFTISAVYLIASSGSIGSSHKSAKLPPSQYSLHTLITQKVREKDADNSP